LVKTVKIYLPNNDTNKSGTATVRKYFVSQDTKSFHNFGHRLSNLGAWVVASKKQKRHSLSGQLTVFEKSKLYAQTK
jgi:hypothetical protein